MRAGQAINLCCFFSSYGVSANNCWEVHCVKDWIIALHPENNSAVPYGTERSLISGTRHSATLHVGLLSTAPSALDFDLSHT